MADLHGPGDEATWPKHNGHNHDPRTDYNPDTDPRVVCDAAADLIARATRALERGNKQTAADLYREAAEALQDAANMAEELA